MTANDSRVCHDPVHIAIEQRYIARGQARFKLHELLQRARMAGSADSLPDPSELASLTESLAAEEESTLR